MLCRIPFNYSDASWVPGNTLYIVTKQQLQLTDNPTAHLHIHIWDKSPLPVH